MIIDTKKAANTIVNFIRQETDEFCRDGAILGMSGGIDSSLTASLLVEALGKEKVFALLLPERDSSPESKSDALIEIKRLGIDYYEVDLTSILSTIGIYNQVPLHFLGTQKIKEAVVKRQHKLQTESLGEMPFLAGLLGTRDLGKNKAVIDSGNAYARIKHRLRLVILYYYAELQNLLVTGTTNRSEAMTGFVVKWGDNVADIEPILPLYKTQVRQLAAHLGVSQHILDKDPTPDLMPGIVDEIALGIDYNTLDKILWGIDHEWDDHKIAAAYKGVDKGHIDHVRQLVKRSKHLRSLPPVPNLKNF
jgi:NAD+ synthase